MDRVQVMVASLVLALAGAGGALAHGDPTSHYLETENFLTTYASPPATAVELQLRGLLDAVERRGYPIKVSLIASTGDTGGDTPPLEDTQWYAERVGEELESVRPLQAPILIVTPGTIGVAGNQLRDGRLRPIRAADARALVRGVALAGRPDGTALARSAMHAIRQVARAGGHPLPKNVPPASADLTGSVLAQVAAQHESSGRSTGVWALAIVLATLPFLALGIYAVSRSSRRAQS